MYAQNWAGMDAVAAKSIRPRKCLRATPSIRPTVPAKWDAWPYKGGTLRHFAAPATLWELRPPYAISEHTFTKQTF